MPVMNIKARREALGLSQAELGARMGVVQGAVANWEAEISLPKARDLPLLATVLGCTIDALFVHEDGEKAQVTAGVSSFDPGPED